MAIQTVKLSAITRDGTIQIRKTLNKKAIERYMEADDLLPPIDLFKVDDALIIADGWHREAAARQRGLKEIRANVHKGTLEDAEAFAITANCKHGMPLSPGERNTGILRLAELKWASRKIAEEMSIDHTTVSAVLRALSVGKLVGEIPQKKTYKKQELTQQDMLAIAKADQKDWKPLAMACLKGNWTARETEQSVKNWKDPQNTAEDKKEILSGCKPWVIIEKDDGTRERGILGSTISQYMKDAKDDDGYAVFLEIVNLCHRFKHHSPKKVVQQAADFRGGKELDNFANDIEWIEKMLSALTEELATRKNGLRVVASR